MNNTEEKKTIEKKEKKSTDISPQKQPYKKNKKAIVAIFGIIIVAIAVLFWMFFFGNDINRVNYDTAGYINLGNYEGLEVAEITATITDDDVDFEIAQLLEENKEQVSTDVVEEGTTVNIDYIGKKDGVAFEGGTAEAASLEIGSGTFIDGFEDGLIGYKVGDNVVLSLTFPEEYQEESLAGEDVEFEVTINGITKYDYPPLDDDFAKGQGFDTVAELKKDISEYLESNALLTASYDEKIRLLQIIKNESEIIEYPEEQVNAVIEKITNQYKDDAEMNGLSFEDYISQAVQMEMDVFEETVEEYARATIEEELVIYAIAQKEGIEVSEEEYEAYIIESLEGQGVTEEEFKELSGGFTFEEYYGYDSIYFALYTDKVMERVMELGVIK